MIFGVLLVIFISGCATTRPPSQMGQIHIKVAKLEKELDLKDKELTSLKYRVDELESQVGKGAAVYSPDQSMRNLPIIRDEEVLEKTFDDVRKDEIIRVAISAQDLQQALKNAGYYSGKLDGKIGSGTKQAIKEFQRDSGLKVDGVVGQRTWNQLKGYLK